MSTPSPLPALTVKNSILDCIGATPLVRLDRLAQHHDLQCTLLAKLEYFNAGGSVKDRIALRMVEEAEKEGRLVPGKSVVWVFAWHCVFPERTLMALVWVHPQNRTYERKHGYRSRVGLRSQRLRMHHHPSRKDEPRKGQHAQGMLASGLLEFCFPDSMGVS